MGNGTEDRTRLLDPLLEELVRELPALLLVNAPSSTVRLVDFAFSDDQEELRRTVRRWLDEQAPSATVRRLMESDRGYDPEQWTHMASLGWQGIAISEDLGGAGFGLLELSILFEEMGRSLYPAPFLSSIVLAAGAIQECGDEQQRRKHLPGLATGTTIGALAYLEPNGRLDQSGVEAVAVQGSDGWEITGTKSYVIDGHIADLLVVAARTPTGVGLFLVSGDSPEVERLALSVMDLTRKQAEIALQGAPADLLGDPRVGWQGLQRVLEKAVVILAVEQVGGAQRCLDMAVEYAKVRHQFGRPIGSFQAIKHKCAEMLVQVESARSAAYYAAWAASEDNDELPIVAPLAKSYCSEAYLFCAGENIQIHGGIGFTWEHDAHLYYKRAKSSQLMFGDPAYHREILGDRLGL